jgi:hypothetical protein
MEEQETRDTSPTIGKLATALVKAQAEMPAAKFDATNPFLKNKYATLGCVIETARPILAKHGLAIMQPVVSSRNGDIGIRTMVIHESGEFISSEAYMPILEQKGVSLAQVAGSIISYLRRYSISSMLGIYADEDTDANDDEPSKKKPSKKKSAKQELDDTFGAKKTDRPYSPETIRNRMAKSVEKYKGVRKSDKMMELLVWQLNECFAGDEDQNEKRHSITAYLFEKDSATDLSGAEMKSIIQWLDSSEDEIGDFKPSKDARDEAIQIVVTRMKEQGQQELL